MASKKKTAGTAKLNKSQFIRDNPGLSVKEVIEKAKADHGVTLSAGLVYTTRSQAKGAKPGPKGKPGRKPGPKPKAAGGGGSISAMITAEIARLENRVKGLRAALSALKD